MILNLIGIGVFLLIICFCVRFLQNSKRTSESGAPVPFFGKSGRWILRGIFFFVLSLLLTIPLMFTGMITDERSDLYKDVVRGIGNDWGRGQIFSGPYITVPYSLTRQEKSTVEDKGGLSHSLTQDVVHNYTAVFLPEALSIDASLRHEMRSRSIYQVLVYQGDLTVSGTFKTPKIEMGEQSGRLTVDWQNAKMVCQLSDTRYAMVSGLRFDSVDLDAQPGVAQLDLGGSSGFHAAIPHPQMSPHTFSFTVNIRGSQSLGFFPLGEISRISLRADWPHPNFQGLLPKSHTITESGFSADWEISNLSRNYSQSFTLGEVKSNEMMSFRAEALLFEPVTHYTKVERAIKYGLLFIGITYLVLFLFEFVSNRRLHFVQYILVGLSLAMFYLLLLTLSEHMDFLRSYLISSATVVLSCTLYVGRALRSAKYGALMFVLLTAVYTVLYSILQLEDYALLVGTSLLLVMLFAMMFITRNLRSEDANDEVK